MTKTFQTKVVVCRNGACSHPVIGLIECSSRKCYILLSASRRSWRGGCRLLQVLFACFTRYTISSSTDASLASIAFLDLVFGCLCEVNETHPVYDFWVCSNSELARRLGLFVFFGFGLLFLRSERSEWRPLSSEFWVCGVYLRIFGLLASFGFCLSWPYLA